MRYQGKITNWNDEQGFGFVTPNGGGEKAFVHIKAFSGRTLRPIDGDLVTYSTATDEQRRLRAENIRFVRKMAASKAAHEPVPYDAMFAIFFASILVLGVLIGRLPLALPGLYLGASMLAFLAYKIDKSAAQNNRWRTRESTLHLFAIIGGWPGALLAQKTLRHKSKKKEFKTVFLATVLINCFMSGWFFTKSGSNFLTSILGSVA